MTALANLLSLDPSQRDRSAHEAVFDEFVRSMGGFRVTERYPVKHSEKNADYIVPTPTVDMIVELKQLGDDGARGSIPEYFLSRKASGAISQQLIPNEHDFTLSGPDLGPFEWNMFHRQFRPNLLALLKQANRQLKQTNARIGPTGRRRIKVAWLLQTGDRHLTVDLVTRLALTCVKREWDGGFFRSLESVACGAWDHVSNPHVRMSPLPGKYSPISSPLTFRSIMREPDEALEGAMQSLHDSWLRYIAAEVGGEVRTLSVNGQQGTGIYLPVGHPLRDFKASRDGTVSVPIVLRRQAPDPAQLPE